ncbi:MAG: hypothetical protein J0L57_12300 [Burkholderiales bacterium]|nr:hypothetical protein [Burkholderiales bacterium]
MKRAHFLFAALSFAWGSAVGAPLEPVVSRHGDVRLFDPARPMSTTNPVTVDSGLPPGASFGVLRKGTLSGGRRSGVENSLLGYFKGQQLFTVGLGDADDRTPRRVSLHADFCDVVQDARSVRTPARTWVLTVRSGPDRTCFTGDDVFTAVRVDTPQDQPGKSPAGLRNLFANLTATGTIAGLLTIEKNPAGSGPAMVHRSAGFGSRQLVMPLADTGTFGGSFYRHYKELPAYFYFKLTPAGTSVQQLYRYDRPGNGLSLVGPLHTFAATGPDESHLSRGTADLTHFYFQDGRTILRVPHDASGPAAVQTLAALDFGLYGMRTNAAMDRVVFDSDYGVQSVLKTGGGLVSLATGGYNELVAVGGSGQVYTNVTGYTRPIPVTARQIAADGSSVLDTPNAYFSGVTMPAAFDYDADFDNAPASVVRVTLSGGNAVLSLRKAADGSARRTLGTVFGVLSLTAFCDQYGGDGFCSIADLIDHSRGHLECHGGAYCAFGALIDRGDGASDIDAYLFDSRVGASVAPMQVTPGVDDLVGD